MTLLSIPGMTCGHCRTAVETALGSVPGAGPVVVDLDARTAKVGGTAPVAALVAALAAAGYEANPQN